MFCTNCGNHNTDGVEKCAFCGASMNPETLQQPVNPQPYQNSQYQPYASQPYNQQPYNQQPYNQQGYPQQSYGQMPYTTPVEVPGRGLGIASLVVGIISLVMFCIFYISIPCAIAGLIMGCIGNSKAKAQGLKNGVAVGGIVCSAIGIALAIIFILLIAIGVSSTLDGLYSYGY